MEFQNNSALFPQSFHACCSFHHTRSFLWLYKTPRLLTAATSRYCLYPLQPGLDAPRATTAHCPLPTDSMANQDGWALPFETPHGDGESNLEGCEAPFVYPMPGPPPAPVTSYVQPQAVNYGVVFRPMRPVHSALSLSTSYHGNQQQQAMPPPPLPPPNYPLPRLPDAATDLRIFEERVMRLLNSMDSGGVRVQCDNPEQEMCVTQLSGTWGLELQFRRPRVANGQSQPLSVAILSQPSPSTQHPTHTPVTLHATDPPNQGSPQGRDFLLSPQSAEWDLGIGSVLTDYQPFDLLSSQCVDNFGSGSLVPSSMTLGGLEYTDVGFSRNKTPALPPASVVESSDISMAPYQLYLDMPRQIDEAQSFSRSESQQEHKPGTSSSDLPSPTSGSNRMGTLRRMWERVSSKKVENCWPCKLVRKAVRYHPSRGKVDDFLHVLDTRSDVTGSAILGIHVTDARGFRTLKLCASVDPSGRHRSSPSSVLHVSPPRIRGGQRRRARLRLCHLSFAPRLRNSTARKGNAAKTSST